MSRPLWNDGIDGGEVIGVDSHWAATAAYWKISPNLRNFVVLFDSQQFGDMADTTRKHGGAECRVTNKGGGSMLIIIII